MTEPVAEELRFEMQGAMGVITLDRPRALNALTVAMRARMTQAFPKIARDPIGYCMVQRSASPKAFSAGGDVRELIALWQESPDAARKALADEYALNWLIECFSKPTISLIGGAVMGSGVGITQYGTHRVAGAGYRFAMPETMIGLFPDVGNAFALARLPKHAGFYLGLTGRTIGRADAYALGLATHCIADAAFADIMTALADAQPVDPELDSRHADPGPGELAPHLGTIDRCFAASTVEEIIERLNAITGPEQGWARGVVADLSTRSPLSLKVTLRHIREAKAQDLRQTLQVDYRLACRFLADHDFAEGVRAVLVDKDGQPRWKPATLADVSDSMVEAYFEPMGAHELVLPTRAEMQAARV